MSAANLGDIAKRLRLQCAACEWLPPEDATVEAIQLHCQVDHDTSDVKLNLVPVCRCGAAMTHASSHEHSAMVTDFFRCSTCGNTGHVTRKADAP